MIPDALKDLEHHIEKAFEVMQRDLGKVRTGRANTAMLDGIRVDYYGTPTPLTQVASVTISDPRLIVIKPWEKNLLPLIEKAVRDAGLGINPSLDGDIVRLPIPPLTQDRRKELAKIVSKTGEETKVAIRNCRRDSREKLEKLNKDGKLPEDDLEQGQKKIQAVIDKATSKVDDMIAKKQSEITEV